jgi:sugar transferase (PEP-CTERM system associated)
LVNISRLNANQQEIKIMSTVRFFRHSTQLFQHQIPTDFVLLGVVEFLALILALYLGLELRFWGGDWQLAIGSFLPKALLYAFVMQISLVAMGVYQRQMGRFKDVLMLRIGSGLLLGLVPLGVSYYVVPTFFLGRGVLTLTVIISFLLISSIRLYYRRVVKERNMWSRVLVLGSGDNADLVRKAAKSGELKGLNIIGYVPMSGDRGHEIDYDRISLDEPLIQYVEEKGVDEIVLAVDDRRDGLPANDLLECKMSGVDILDLLSFLERRTGKIRLDILYPSWLYLSSGFRESTFRRVGKRVFDLTVVLLLLPVMLPLGMLAALAIFLESRGSGSVLYQQTRVKENGKLFQIYKFRSMVADAEQDGVACWASKNDFRITRVGSVLRKVRLDELPQLFNIIKGDMSFVGPRPERPEFVAQFARNIPYYAERHRVKPGLTGWAQIRYPYGDSDEDALEKLQYDLYYVKNYSIFLDLLVLLQTAEVVMLGKGAQ